MSLARELVELLSRRLPAAGPVLVVGWPPGEHPAPAAGRPPAAAAAGGLAAICWRVDSAASGAALDAALADFRGRLAGGGLLLAAVPVEGEQEALPRPAQVLLREVVRAASEGGWSLRRDETAAGHRLLSLRPDPYLFRAYRDGDEEAILALFAACFPHARRGLDHWRWKYRDNPWGRHLISLAIDGASPGAPPAVHYGGFPAPYSLRLAGGRRREVVAMQMADTMTRPDHRDVGRGRSALLPRTVRHFFSRRRDGRLDFYFGFNTGPIQRFCEWFIGGFLVEPVGFWTRGPEPPAVPRLRVEEVTSPPGAAWDRLFRRAADAYGSLLRRDARYVGWRYLACPDGRFVVLAVRRFGRLVGWGAFRRDGDRLLWGDALFAPGAGGAGAPAALLAAALAHPRLAGATRVETWSPPRPPWWEADLHRLGFAREPHPQGLGMVALTNPGGVATPELLRNSYYAMGDSDLF